MAIQQIKLNQPKSSFESDIVNLLRYIDQSAAIDDKNRAQNRTIFIQTVFTLLLSFSFLAVPLFVFYDHLFSFVPSTIVDDLMWECKESTARGYASYVVIFFMTTADILATVDRDAHHIIIVSCIVQFFALTATALSHTAYAPGMSFAQKRKMLCVRAVVTQRILRTKCHHILDRISKCNAEGKDVQPMSTSEVLAVVRRLNRIYQREQPELFKKEKQRESMVEQQPIQQEDARDNNNINLGEKMRRCAVVCIRIPQLIVQQLVKSSMFWQKHEEKSREKKDE